MLNDTGQEKESPAAPNPRERLYDSLGCSFPVQAPIRTLWVELFALAESRSSERTAFRKLALSRTVVGARQREWNIDKIHHVHKEQMKHKSAEPGVQSVLVVMN